MSQPVFQYLSLLNALLCTVRSPWLFQPSKSLAQQLHPHSTFEWGYRVSRRRQWHPTPVLLPGKSHGWRSLEGCSPWSRWGSDTTKWLHFHFSLSCIGEGNGNPLQCSCLESSRDRGAWWAAIYGVAQSRTWLKWLSSSSDRLCSRKWSQRKVLRPQRWFHWLVDLTTWAWGVTWKNINGKEFFLGE